MLLLLCIMSETDSDLGDLSQARMTTFLDSANAKFAMSVTPARLRVYRLANTHPLHSVSGLIDATASP